MPEPLTPRITALSFTLEHAAVAVTVNLTEHGSTDVEGAAALIRSAESLLAGDRALHDAWAAGWRALFEQFEKQKHDPTHPITSNNPYAHDDRGARGSEGA